MDDGAAAHDDWATLPAIATVLAHSRKAKNDPGDHLEFRSFSGYRLVSRDERDWLKMLLCLKISTEQHFLR